MAKRQGFTLIELLVVIAIIAVLISILMPALNRAKQSAKNVICLSNLHEWGIIWMLYTNDNKGFFSRGTGVGWERGEWITALRPNWETKSEILLCPLANKRLPSGAEHGGPFNSYIMGEATGGYEEYEECSYGINCWVYNPAADVSDIQERPTAYNWRSPNVRGGGDVPVFADTMWRGGGPWHYEEPPEYNGQWKDYDYEIGHFCIDRHGNRMTHILFMDWSVRLVGLKQLWQMKWHRNWNADKKPPPVWPEWMKDMKDF